MTVRKDQGRGSLGQWHQHEGSLCHLRVRKRQARRDKTLVIEEQKVQVQGTWPPASFANPTMALFEGLQLIEQGQWRQACLQLGHCVDEVRLVRRADRPGGIKMRGASSTGQGQLVQLVQGAFDMGSRRIQIAAEADPGKAHVSSVGLRGLRLRRRRRLRGAGVPAGSASTLPSRRRCSCSSAC